MSIKKALLVAAVMGLAVNAHAVDQDLSINATVSSVCTFNNITSVEFGAVDPWTAKPSPTGSIKYSCNGSSPKIQMDGGLHSGQSIPRNLQLGSSGSLLGYRLYNGTSATDEWTLDPKDKTHGVVAGQVTLPIYAETIPTTTSTDAGSYTDTVKVTLSAS